jgi:hypothetical protein
MAMANQPWVDLFVIGDTGDRVLDREMETSWGYEAVADAFGLVDVVIQLCTEGRDIAKMLRTLRISSHGAPTHFYIGKDQVNLAVLKEANSPLKTALSMLGAYLDSQRSLVVIDACYTGMNHGLLGRLSQIWNGVRVKGFVGEETANAAWPGDESGVIVCRATSCAYHDAYADPNAGEGLGRWNGRRYGRR